MSSTASLPCFSIFFEGVRQGVLCDTQGRHRAAPAAPSRSSAVKSTSLKPRNKDKTPHLQSLKTAPIVKCSDQERYRLGFLFIGDDGEKLSLFLYPTSSRCHIITGRRILQPNSVLSLIFLFSQLMLKIPGKKPRGPPFNEQKIMRRLDKA